MTPRYPRWFRIGLALLLVAILVALGIANYRFVLEAPGGNDFLARWVGAHSWLVEGINPYDPEVSLLTQEMIYGRPANPSEGEDIAHFAYPLPAMVFIAPFGLLPYPVARAVWMTLLEVLLPLLALIGTRIAHWTPSRKMMALLLLFSVMWYHGMRSIILGQFAVIEAFLISAALLAIQRRKDALAGMSLALSIAKPQMAFLLIPFSLIWAGLARRWAVVYWTLGSMAVLIGVSLFVLPGWPIFWLRQLLEYPEYTEPGSPISIIASSMPRISEEVTLAVTALALIYLFWEWILAFRKHDRWFQWTAAVTLVVTNLVAFRTATTNYVVLLPALTMVFGMWCERWERRGGVWVVFAVLSLTVGLWSLFLFTIEGNLEGPAMFIPLPLLTLGGLWWSRWWATRASTFPT